ncbi:MULTISPECIES: tape measure protein [unclassified Acinetobacter]|uniref:tape measure protein n=1 Tax=unclassified Acinetobacter TaxID=196816 RepID=UPI00244933C7|nr:MULTISPECIES: tape measure protein [unclassified Acinetobacter]MDH0032003.1 tape measure protein [Acinetobacter sp. GD04021]MDH0887659.1 tape measure protein [Acinetobacter sp. GD03873]MDH1084007.1 tape measure protein [Acinetobacter sp. GD03983]MDH2191066.1 tape measure protein [Acinetobacter sp. GD03645]MDH2204519.1 tape measure protein [Acinetobacter sp. GD03647]
MTTDSLDFLVDLRANTTGFNQGIEGAKFAVNALIGAMAALGVGLGAKELAEAADSYAMLSARIQQATKDGGNFENAIAGVHQIALSTNSSLDATAGLFTKLNTVAKDMGKSQQFALDMTSTVTKAIQLGGGSAQASEAAVQQFIQAMQGGVLRGEEFNSIMENGYGLAEALAKGLGVTTGELRKMAENGELSAERVLAALAKQKAGVDTQYAEMPTTISNALQKIATSWQIVIGQMDQANGASATVAKWLSTLADNLDVVEVLLSDIGLGFIWFGDQLKKIDPQTIESLKAALLSAYDAVKSLGLLLAGAFEPGVDVINTMLGQIFNFSSGIDSATDKTNGFTKALQAVNVVFGFLSDGFKAINIGVNLITGAAYDAAAAFSYWKSKLTFGDTSAQALKDFEVMSTKAQEYYKKSADGAMEFKSAGVEAIRQISLTQDEKNAERVVNNAKTLSDLKSQETQHVADYKAISDERIKLQQQLVDARKIGDQSAIDAAIAGLAELDKKEKTYQTESKKISDEKIKAAQDWVNAQITAMDGTVKAADAATQKTLQTAIAAQGLAVEFDKTGKAIVKAIAVDAGEAVVSLDTRLGQGRKAAAALGVDLDVALNKVSDGFLAKSKSLDDFTKNLELMGATGDQAATIIYDAWSKWLETAKSQAEIDAAKAKLKEFEEQGVFSTKQVEMGMLAIKQVTEKLPNDLDEVGKAFERLGIKTKEQLKLAAESAIADFNTIQASGQATTEGVRQAYERVMQAAAASGDEAVIANAKAKGASVGLQAQIDATGKASVQSTQEIVDSLYNVGETARGSAAQGFRELGRVAREEAKSTADKWLEAMAKVDAERKAKTAETAKGLSELQGGIDQMSEDYFNRLVAAGMDSSRARDLADKAKLSLAQETTDALRGGNQLGVNTTKQQMEKTLAYWENKNSKSGASISLGGNAPVISAPNIEPPQIQQVKMPNIDSGPDKNVRIELAIGNSKSELYGTQSQVDATEELFRQLEEAKKRS